MGMHQNLEHESSPSGVVFVCATHDQRPVESSTLLFSQMSRFKSSRNWCFGTSQSLLLGFALAAHPFRATRTLRCRSPCPSLPARSPVTGDVSNCEHGIDLRPEHLFAPFERVGAWYLLVPMWHEEDLGVLWEKSGGLF